LEYKEALPRASRAPIVIGGFLILIVTVFLVSMALSLEKVSINVDSHVVDLAKLRTFHGI
jgi:hypothetical protein